MRINRVAGRRDTIEQEEPRCTAGHPGEVAAKGTVDSKPGERFVFDHEAPLRPGREVTANTSARIVSLEVHIPSSSLLP